MSYRFELHCHTAEVSYCASCPAEQSVALLKARGYDGVAITNHYYRDWFTSKEGSWEEKADLWLSGYRLAKTAGDAQGVAVVLGVELGFDCCPNNHYLSFGMEESFFHQYPRLYEMTPSEYWRLANRLGLYFGQAHPLRGENFCHPEDPSILHGMEFYNGHGDHGNHNDVVYGLVEKTDLTGTVGSDFHHPYQAGTTAMLFPILPRSSAELAGLLLQNKIDGYEIKAKEIDDIPSVFQQDSRFLCAKLEDK